MQFKGQQGLFLLLRMLLLFHSPRRGPRPEEAVGSSRKTVSVLLVGWESFPPQKERWNLSPGNMATLAKLTDPERRPPLREEVVNSFPEPSFELEARSSGGPFRNDSRPLQQRMCPWRLYFEKKLVQKPFRPKTLSSQNGFIQ